MVVVGDGVMGVFCECVSGDCDGVPVGGVELAAVSSLSLADGVDMTILASSDEVASCMMMMGVMDGLGLDRLCCN